MEEYQQVLVNLPVKEKPAVESVPEIQAAIEAVEKRLGHAGRTLVRYSGTEHKIRVLVEARDSEVAQREAEVIVAAVQRAIGVGPAVEGSA